MRIATCASPWTASQQRPQPGLHVSAHLGRRPLPNLLRPTQPLPHVFVFLSNAPCRYQSNSNVTVKNTGTTLQVNFEPGSNSITWAGQHLELLQYHFHNPSEHTVEGAHSSMEAHLVHRNKATGVLAVAAARGGGGGGSAVRT